MTHWLRSALRRNKERSAQSAPATVRGGPSRKTKGVSTVEYALILVAVVAIVGAGAVVLGGDFKTMFKEIGEEMEASTTEAKEAGDVID